MADKAEASGKGSSPDPRLVSFLRSIDKATEAEEEEKARRRAARSREPRAEQREEVGEESDSDATVEGDLVGSGDEEGQPVSAPPIEFANAMARVLGKHIPGDQPVLSKRKTPNMRLMEQEKEEGRERRQTVVDRRERRERFCVKPDPAQLNAEKRLRKVATSGIVQLFNSVRQHQQSLKHEGVADGAASRKQKEKRAAQNDNFLQLLREATGASVSAEGGSSDKAAGKGKGKGKASWAVLDENLMLGSSSMRAWDRDTHEAREGKRRRAAGKGGSESIFVQDRAGDGAAKKIAWSSDEDE